MSTKSFCKLTSVILWCLPLVTAAFSCASQENQNSGIVKPTGNDGGADHQTSGTPPTDASREGAARPRDGTADKPCTLGTDRICLGGPNCCPVVYRPYDAAGMCLEAAAMGGALGCYVDQGPVPCTVDAGIGCQYRRGIDGGLEIIQTGSTYEATPGARRILSDLGFAFCDDTLKSEISGWRACN